MRPRSLGEMVTGALLMTASGYGQAPAPEAAGHLGGRVRRGAAGAQGIRVMLCELVLVNSKARPGAEAKWDGCQTTRDATTDAEGRYEFAGVAPGEYAILARNQDSWSYIGAALHPGSSYVRLNKSYYLYIATHAVRAGRKAAADDILIIDRVKLLEPVAGAQVETGTPTLRWEAIPLAAYYEVSLYTAAPFGNDYLSDTVKPVLAGRRADTSSLAVAKALANCDYSWEVRAFDAARSKVAESVLVQRGSVLQSRFRVVGQRTTCR